MSDVRWLSAEEESAWRAYRRMRTRLDLQLGRDLARDSQLSESDYDVLSTLTERPGRSWRASELAAQLLWSTSRLAHHAGRMERRGLIARGECAEDGRGATLTLTDAGWAALRAAAPAHVASVRRHFIDLLAPSEVAALASLAGKVLDHLAGPPGDPGERAGQGELSRDTGAGY
jgi:DNA-binding MarR family transcriptional regulator